MLDAGPRISQLDESLYWKLCNFAIVTSKKIEKTAKVEPGSATARPGAGKSALLPECALLVAVFPAPRIFLARRQRFLLALGKGIGALLEFDAQWSAFELERVAK
jgi:hypothetical protein